MYTINGVGTKLYGSTDKKSDGSYVATKWFVFIFIPLIPLGSYRIWLKDNLLEMPGNTAMVIDNKPEEKRFKMQKVTWNWGQICKTYLIAFVIILFIYLIGLFFGLK